MKKLTLLFLAFTFCLNSFAATGTADELARAFDDFQYSITVDWDQKDQKAYQAMMNTFYEKLDKLTQKDGMAVSDLEKMVEEKVKDPKVVSALRLKVQLLGKSASREDILSLLRSESSALYSKGASWNGDATLTYGIIALVVGIVAYAIYFQLTHDCVKYEEGNTYSCSASQHYSCDYSGFDCGYVDGPEHCGYNTICTQYVKK